MKALTQFANLNRLGPSYFGAMAMLLILNGLAAAQADRNKYNQLLLPTSRQGQASLAQHCQLWSMRPLRDSCQELEATFPVTVWLDGSVDPLRTANVAKSDGSTTLGSELGRLAVSCGYEGGLIENVYVIAPAQKLRRMQRAAVVLHGQLVAAAPTIAESVRPLRWPEITSSQEMLQLIQSNWKLDNLESTLPHDLFHEGQLPACSLATQLTLLLGRFELQAVVESKAQSSTTESKLPLRFEPLSSETVWDDSYDRTLTAARLLDLRQTFPQGELDVIGPKVKVKGETNLHVQVLTSVANPRGRPKPNSTEDAQRFTFEIKAPVPVEAVLQNLAKRLDFQVRWSDSITAAHKTTLIQLQVNKATRSELLQQVATAAELNIIDQQQQIVVSPKSN